MRQTQETKKKGRLVERIAAEMHTGPGIEVQTNVRLAPKGGGSKSNEIDILITGRVAGHSARFAVECKNHYKPVTKAQVTEFAGKLKLVGIPEQCGIFVTASGYTGPAQEAAKQYGIKLLLLEGLDETRTAEAVFDAIQNTVTLVASVELVAISNDSEHMTTYEFGRLFLGGDLKHSILVPDLLHGCWTGGTIGSELGRYRVRITPPASVFQKVGSDRVKVSWIDAIFRVSAIVVDIPGKFTQSTLLEYTSRDPNKARIQARFDPSKALAFRPFVSQAKLDQKLSAHPQRLAMTTRVQLPRIILRKLFWPPSERVWRKLVDIGQSGIPQDDPRIQNLSFEDFEPDPSSLWEQPMQRPNASRASVNSPGWNFSITYLDEPEQLADP